MMDWIERVLHHGQYRREATESLLRKLRTQTQIAELQRFQMEQQRKKAEMHWLEKALITRRREEVER